jgi:hypothetical protein
MKYIYLVVIFSFLNSACSDSYKGTLTDLYPGDQLSVNGFIGLDSLYILVGKTANPYSAVFTDSDLIAENSRVFILDQDDVLIDEVFSIDGIHFTKSLTGLKPNAKYYIKVSAANLPVAETELIEIPTFVPIDSLNIIENNPLFGNSFQLNVFFKDIPEVDYYFTEIGVIGENGVGRNATTGVINEEINSACYRIGAFDDGCFQNGTGLLQFGVIKDYQFGSSAYQSARFLVLRIGSVSKSIYDYYQSLPTDDALIDGLNEPSITYSNVKNGVGYVFGQNWKDIKVELK